MNNITVEGTGEVAYKVYFQFNFAPIRPNPVESDIDTEIEVQRYWILQKILILKSEYRPQMQVIPMQDFEELQEEIEKELVRLNKDKWPREKIPNHTFYEKMFRWPTDKERKMLGLK